MDFSSLPYIFWHLLLLKLHHLFTMRDVTISQGNTVFALINARDVAFFNQGILLNYCLEHFYIKANSGSPNSNCITKYFFNMVSHSYIMMDSVKNGNLL